MLLLCLFIGSAQSMFLTPPLCPKQTGSQLLAQSSRTQRYVHRLTAGLVVVDLHYCLLPCSCNLSSIAFQHILPQILVLDEVCIAVPSVNSQSRMRKSGFLTQFLSVRAPPLHHTHRLHPHWTTRASEWSRPPWTRCKRPNHGRRWWWRTA